MKRSVVAVVGILAVSGMVLAGNVKKVTDPKEMLKYEDTPHNATLTDYNYDGVVAGPDIVKPIGGKIGDISIDGIKLSLSTNEFVNGGVDTKELGHLNIRFGSDLTSEGFVVLLNPDQLKKLEGLKAKK